jgi:hypothetical protein
MTDNESRDSRTPSRPGPSRARGNRLASVVMGVCCIVGLVVGTGAGALFGYPGFGAGMGIIHGAALALLVAVFLPK